MTTLEQLQKIAELDEDVQFFVDNIKTLIPDKNTNNGEFHCLWSESPIGIVLEENTLNYKIYDPFNQVTKAYKDANGWTAWSLNDLGGVK